MHGMVNVLLTMHLYKTAMCSPLDAEGTISRYNIHIYKSAKITVLGVKITVQVCHADECPPLKTVFPECFWQGVLAVANCPWSKYVSL